MPTTVTQKGQVTIPRDVRVGAGLHPGTRVDVVLENGRAMVMVLDEGAAGEVRRQDMLRRIEAFRAKHPPLDMTTEEIMEGVREPVPL